MTDNQNSSPPHPEPVGEEERMRPDFARFTAIDIETTSLNPEEGEIIELGAVRFVNGKETEIFRTLVKPEAGLPERNRRLTGIDPSMLEDAQSVNSALREFREFISDDLLISHNSAFDMGFLAHHLDKQGIDAIENPAVCTLHLSALVNPEAETLQLGILAANWDIAADDQHRALQDARMAGRLAVRLMDKIRSWPTDFIAHLAGYRGKSLDPVFDLLDDIIVNAETDDSWRLDEAVFNQLHHPETTDSLPLITSTNGDSYITSPPDTELENEVRDAFDRGGVTLLDDMRPGAGPASCSVPVDDANLLRLVVGVPDEATIHLVNGPDNGTDGSGGKDRSVYLGQRSEYICCRRAFDETGRPHGWLELSPYERIVLARWLAGTRTGRIARVNWWLLNNFSGLKGHLNSLAASTMECLCAELKTDNPCYAEIAKARSAKAGRIVVDQKHLCLERSEDAGSERLLGEIEVCVIEKASLLQHAARAAESRILEIDSLRRRLAAISEALDESFSEELKVASSAVSDLFVACRETMKAYRDSHPRDSSNPIAVDPESWGREEFSGLSEALGSGSDALVKLANSIRESQELSGEEKIVHRTLSDSADTIRLFRELPAGWAGSLEGAPARNPKRINLVLVPVQVEDVVRRIIDDTNKGVLAVDRHLRYQGSFDRIRLIWGLSADIPVEERVLEDASLALPYLFLPEDVSAPATRSGRRYHWEKYMERTANLLRMIADALGGRTVAAFSAHHELRRVRDLLRDDPPTDCVVLAQYQDGTKSALVREYLANQSTVLLGGRNFLDGVDLRPAGFTALVLVKLPFVSPEEPLHRAALQALDTDYSDGMQTYLVPLAVETSNKWIDSLIAGALPMPEGDKEHDTDASLPAGAVIILDPRAVLNEWGLEFVSALNARPSYRLTFRDMINKLGEMKPES